MLCENCGATHPEQAVRDFARKLGGTDVVWFLDAAFYLREYCRNQQWLAQQWLRNEGSQAVVSNPAA